MFASLAEYLLSMRGLGFFVVAGLTGAVTFLQSAKAYPNRSGVFIRLLCSVLLASCATTFQLILCEVLQAGDAELRSQLWKTTTAFLLLILGLVAPLVQFYRIFTSKFPRFKILFVVCYTIYLFVFRLSSTQLPIERYVDEHQKQLRDPSGWFDLRQDSLACISFAGITTMALLCGISSVTAPYTAFFCDQGEVSDVDASRLEKSIKSIDELVQTKELEISRLRLDISRSRTSKHDSHGTASGSETGFMSRLVNMVRPGDSRQAELKSLQVEQEALKNLKLEVQSDLDSVKRRIDQQKFRKTLFGRVHRLVFAIFALYCMYRVCNSYLRMGWWFFQIKKDTAKTGPKDALVLLIAQWINKLIPEFGVQAWTRIIGVFMSGAVFTAALNGALRTLQRVMRAVHKVPTALPLDLLFVGQVVGVYVLSIATTLRLNLPRSMSGPIMAALASPLKVSSVQLWNDTVLCLTSTVVMVGLFAMSKLNAEDKMYDEEMGKTY